MIINTIKTLIADESGATAIEYGLIASLVSIAGISAFSEMGSSLRALFGHVENQLNTVPTQS